MWGTQEIIKRFDACSLVPEGVLSKAYKQQLETVHPDKNIGNELAASQATDLLVKAWERLKDPTERRLYDNEMKVNLRVRKYVHVVCEKYIEHVIFYVSFTIAFAIYSVTHRYTTVIVQIGSCELLTKHFFQAA